MQKGGEASSCQGTGGRIQCGRMKSKCAFLFVAALHACAPIPGDREVDSSSELFRLQVGDTAHVDLALIDKEMGIAVRRPGAFEASDIFRVRRSLVVEWMNQKPDANQILVVRSHRDRSEDGCVLRMDGEQGQATVVKFMK